MIGKVSPIGVFYLLCAASIVSVYHRFGNVLNGFCYIATAKEMQCMTATLFWTICGLLTRTLSRLIFEIKFHMISIDPRFTDEFWVDSGYFAYVFLNGSPFVKEWNLWNKVILFQSVSSSLMSALPAFGEVTVLPTISRHVRLYSYNIILLAIYMSMLCDGIGDFWKSGEVQDLLTCCIAMDLLCVAVWAFAWHTLFVFDRENMGNSIGAERKSGMVFAVLRCVGSLPFLAFSLWRILEWNAVVVNALRLLVAFRTFFLAEKDLSEMRKASHEGPVGREASEQDIERDPICLVCRAEMHVGEARVLGCGHCFHAECLERWLDRQHTCPLCDQSIQ
jgi:hypothetical protein